MSNSEENGDNVQHARMSPGHYVVTGLPTTADDEITLLGLWQVFWGQRYLILVISAIFAVSSITVALLMTEIYRADSVLAPVDVDEMPDVASRLGGLASLAGIKVGGSSDSMNAVAILRSREFAADFIADEELISVFFADQWDAESKTWLVDKPENAPRMWDAVKYFHENVFSVKEDPMSGLVTIAVDWEDPVIAARWVNELVDRINRETRARALQEAEKNLTYLRAQLDTASVMELRSAISRLIESELKTIMLANAREQYAFRVIDSAMVPTKKVRPRRALIVVTSTFLGGLLALVIALTRHTIQLQRREWSTNGKELRTSP